MSSKRTPNQRKEEKVQVEDEYDEYLYYPYQGKTTADGRYQYVPDDDAFDQVDDDEGYQQEQPVHNLPPQPQAPVQRT